MKGHGEKLSRKQELALAALLEMPTIGKAAKQIGVGEATLWRWLQNQDFQARYQEAKRQTVAQAITRLQKATGEAVEALRFVMNDPEAPASARVSAAKAVLDTAIKGIEFEELIRRVDIMEQKLEKVVAL